MTVPQRNLPREVPEVKRGMASEAQMPARGTAGITPAAPEGQRQDYLPGTSIAGSCQPGTAWPRGLQCPWGHTPAQQEGSGTPINSPLLTLQRRSPLSACPTPGSWPGGKQQSQRNGRSGPGGHRWRQLEPCHPAMCSAQGWSFAQPALDWGKAPSGAGLGMTSPYSAHSPPLRAAMPILLGRGEVSHSRRETEARG